jgi:hypothetical protein
MCIYTYPVLAVEWKLASLRAADADMNACAAALPAVMALAAATVAALFAALALDADTVLISAPYNI